VNPRSVLGFISLVTTFALTDGAHAEAPPGRYEVAPDTVRDTRTKLMWQRFTANDDHTWDEANAYCETLELAGFSDWRLPNVAELGSLVDYTRVDPAIDSKAFPKTPAIWTWASPQIDNVAWVIYFNTGASGRVHTDEYTDTEGNRILIRAKVRCVR
jgi:hypothetical protein